MFLFELPRNGRNHLLSVCMCVVMVVVLVVCVINVWVICLWGYIIKPSLLFLFFFQRENLSLNVTRGSDGTLFSSDRRCTTRVGCSPHRPFDTYDPFAGSECDPKLKVIFRVTQKSTFKKQKQTLAWWTEKTTHWLMKTVLYYYKGFQFASRVDQNVIYIIKIQI